MKHPRIVVQPTCDVLDRFAGVHWLNSDEDARLTRLQRPEDRDDFRASHHLVRQVAADWLDTDPARLDLRQLCDTCGGPHGQPRVFVTDSGTEPPPGPAPGTAPPGDPAHDGVTGGPAPVHVSLAHSHGWVAVAAGGGPVGIDVEARLLTPDALEVTAPRVCAPQEWALVRDATDPPARFAQLWVVKEALVKLGLLTLDGLRDLDVGTTLFPDGTPPLPGAEVPVAGAVVRLWTHPHPCAVAVLDAPGPG